MTQLVSPGTPYAVVTVDHQPGKATQYGVALTTNGKDRVPTGYGPYTTPKQAQAQADRLQAELDKEHT